MQIGDRVDHWEEIYETRNLKEVSWYQDVPKTSLKLINDLDLRPDSKIIDVGAGNSFLVDHLIKKGYTDITVLDISASAIAHNRKRLKEDASKVSWIAGDVTQVDLPQVYDVWHDRAAFHFLNEQADIEAYISKVNAHLKPGGYLIIATFSDKGPLQCSGIDIRQYSKYELAERFSSTFQKIKCFEEIHETPRHKFQHFSFCVLQKKV